MSAMSSGLHQECLTNGGGFLLSRFPGDSWVLHLRPLSCGDVLVHHAIALGLHTTVLVLLKAALNGRSSKLMPDKGAFGYGFPCDGPGHDRDGHLLLALEAHNPGHKQPIIVDRVIDLSDGLASGLPVV